MSKAEEAAEKKTVQKVKEYNVQNEGQRVCINQACQEETLRLNEQPIRAICSHIKTKCHITPLIHTLNTH